MTESANRRRMATALRISLCAQRLADEHGLDGFTMDDLAAAAEVSRRTLFNYFAGKVDAVLGPNVELDPDRVAEFCAGGPDSDLIADLRTLIIDMLDQVVTDRETVERGRRVLRSSPRLIAAVHARYEVMSADIVAKIVEREGPEFDELRGRLAVTLVAALFDSALDGFLADTAEHRPFQHYFDESLRTAHSLFGA